MANWSDLKAAVASIVKTNGNKEITGQLLQNVLNNIISNVGANSSFAGIATPETNPGIPDGNVFYLATTAGTYSNFNGIVINSGEAVILEWKGSWVKKDSGFATKEKLSELEENTNQKLSDLESETTKAKNIKGIFARDSDFTSYNGAYIIDISSSSPIIGDYRVRLASAGVLSDNMVDILLVRDEESVLEGRNYLAELYVNADTLPNEGIVTLTIPHKNADLYGGIDYYITLDVANLKSSFHTNAGDYKIFFDKDYINSKFIKKDNLTSAIIVNDKVGKWDCVKKLDVYIPKEDKHKYYISQLNIFEGYVVFGIKTLEDESIKIYGQTSKSFVVPTEGVSSIPFEKYYNTNTEIDGYYFDIEIDWSLFKNPIVENGTNYIPISPIYGKCYPIKRLDLKCVVLSKQNADLSKWDCVKKLDIYLPKEDNDTYYVSQFNIDGGYMFFGVTSKESGKFLYGQTSANAFTTIPTKGISSIPFESYWFGNEKANGYRFDIEIDWSLFVNPIVAPRSNTGIYVSSLYNNSESIFKGGILNGNYYLSEDVTLPENTHIYGQNCTIYVSDGAHFTLSKNSGIHNIKFVGSWNINRVVNLSKETGLDANITKDDIKATISDETSLGNSFITTKTDDSQNVIIDGCTFQKIGGIVVKLNSHGHRSNQHPVITNCLFTECQTAVYFGGEFIRASNLMIDNCYYGMYIIAGNTNIANCHIKRCDCGVMLKDGTGNGLHGQMVNIQIAHCMTTGLFIHSPKENLGYVLNGCQWADASIESDICRSLMFNGCRMETWINIESGSKNSIHNSIFSKAYANMYGIDFLILPADTSLKGNRGILHCTDSDVNNEIL